MSFQHIEISGSHFRKLNSLQLPGTMILQMHPLHSSNSKLHTLPSFLQSLILITSLFCSSEKVTAYPICPFSISICNSSNSSRHRKYIFQRNPQNLLRQPTDQYPTLYTLRPRSCTLSLTLLALPSRPYTQIPSTPSHFGLTLMEPSSL